MSNRTPQPPGTNRTTAASPDRPDKADPRGNEAAGLYQSLRRELRHFAAGSPLGPISAIVILLFILAAIFAEQLAPYDPSINDIMVMSKPPMPEHLMGTDMLGRDVLTRVLFGCRVSLVVSILAVGLGDTIGFIAGAATGYIGGRVDDFTQRIVEIMLAFPALIFALLLMAGLGPGLHTVIIAIAMTRVPGTLRVIRAVALSTKQMAFVEAARAAGASSWRIIIRHIAPQCFAPMLVMISLGLGSAIFAESALSYLGLGVPAPTPSLGNMLGEPMGHQFNPPWWLIMFPGLVITIIILAANLLGDALRDYLDPRLKYVVRH